MNTVRHTIKLLAADWAALQRLARKFNCRYQHTGHVSFRVLIRKIARAEIRLTKDRP